MQLLSQQVMGPKAMPLQLTIYVVGNVDICSLSLKGNIDSGPTVAISTSYLLVHLDLKVWYILMLWLMDGFVNLSVH